MGIQLYGSSTDMEAAMNDITAMESTTETSWAGLTDLTN